MKIADKHICPKCASSNTQCLGRAGYEKTGGGFGHERILIGYQCKDCSSVFTE